MQLDILFDDNFSDHHFESHSNENGFTFWYASDLMTILEYTTLKSFDTVINKAISTCSTLQIPILNNFVQIERDGILDYKLSRFACYLVVMNADSKKTNVAKAQVYFATLAGAVQDYFQENERMDRLMIRDEVSEREKSLGAVAKLSKVTNYAAFQNAGYLGLYNMNIQQLRKRRDIPSKKSPLDFMGKEELAANLFRITQTELKIKNEKIKGQVPLEIAAKSVGKQVRESMQTISGTSPENLPKKEDIGEVKKELKKKNKTIKAIDKKAKGK